MTTTALKPTTASRRPLAGHAGTAPTRDWLVVVWVAALITISLVVAARLATAAVVLQGHPTINPHRPAPPPLPYQPPWPSTIVHP